MKKRLRVTVVAEYDADPKFYDGHEDPAEMAKIDQHELDTGGIAIADLLYGDIKRVTVEPA